jgi:hypothetical protein
MTSFLSFRQITREKGDDVDTHYSIPGKRIRIPLPTQFYRPHDASACTTPNFGIREGFISYCKKEHQSERLET